MAWPTFTVDVTQNSNQIKVYGPVPASQLPAGFEAIINGIGNLEVSYGTAVMYDGSNNPYSHLYLARPYKGATASNVEMVVKPTGSQFNDVVSIFQNTSNLLNSTMEGFRQFVEGTSPVTFQPLDENAEPISIKPLLQMNQEAQTAVNQAISAFQNAAGTAAGYDVTSNSTDTGNGDNGQPKLLKIGGQGIGTNFKFVGVNGNISNQWYKICDISNFYQKTRLEIIGGKFSSVGRGSTIFVEIGGVSVSDENKIKAFSINGQDLPFSVFRLVGSGVYAFGASPPSLAIITSTSTGDVLIPDFKAVSDPGGISVSVNRIFSTDNIIGSVSQSAGVPTGAIIERGSNANGEYAKFADGTMICTRTEILTSGFPVTLDEKLSIDTVFQTPVTFANAPSVQLTATAYTTGSGGSARKAMSAWIRDQATSFTVGPYSYFSRYGVLMRLEERQFNQPNTVFLFFTAIGRWY
tara:strand:+ start:2544 stop:3938 length:1395 start_codon:yes stop_codon:yes gene_type:complete